MVRLDNLASTFQALFDRLALRVRFRQGGNRYDKASVDVRRENDAVCEIVHADRIRRTRKRPLLQVSTER